jgi:serine/threonine-protein kinase
MPDRVITRFPEEAFWLLEEVAPSGSLRSAPVDYEWAGGQVIFTLPNGMAGYAIMGANGASLNELTSCSGSPECTEPRALNSVTCRGCHGRGLLEVVDDVGAFADSNPTLYEAQTLSRVRAQYLPTGEIMQVLEQDNAVYSAARADAGLPLGTRSSIPRLFYEFQRALTSELAAAELGVTVEQLHQAIRRLEPVLGTSIERAVITSLQGLAASGVPVDRDTFGAGYQRLLCAVLHA